MKLHEVILQPVKGASKEEAEAYAALKALNLDFSIKVDLTAGLREEAVEASVDGIVKIAMFSIPVSFVKAFHIEDLSYSFQYPKPELEE
jgi:hypothetical protein